MSIKVTVHKINTKDKNAIITLIDDYGHVIINKKSIDIELNEEGTSINTNWFNEMIKKQVFSSRFSRLEQNENDIV